MGPITDWYTGRIPELQKFIELNGNADIYVVRSVEPISDHLVIKGWYTSRKMAAAHAVEPRKPEPATAKAVFDEMKLWIERHKDE